MQPSGFLKTAARLRPHEPLCPRLSLNYSPGCRLFLSCGRIAAAEREAGSAPSTVTVPAPGRRRPRISLMSVLLPAPLWPMSATHSPAFRQPPFIVVPYLPAAVQAARRLHQRCAVNNTARMDRRKGGSSPAYDLGCRAIQQELRSRIPPDHLVHDVVRAVGHVGNAIAVEVESRVVAPVIPAAADRTNQATGSPHTRPGFRY